jgi:hypothetical protein
MASLATWLGVRQRFLTTALAPGDRLLQRYEDPVADRALVLGSYALERPPEIRRDPDDQTMVSWIEALRHSARVSTTGTSTPTLMLTEFVHRL